MYKHTHTTHHPISVCVHGITLPMGKIGNGPYNLVLWKSTIPWGHYKDVFAQARSQGLVLLSVDEVVPAVFELFQEKQWGSNAVCATHPIRIRGKKHLLSVHVNRLGQVLITPRPVHVAKKEIETVEEAYWYGSNFWLFKKN